MELFNKGDQLYLDWMNNNPKGFVINTGRGKGSSYAKVHLSNCKHISVYGETHTENSFTTKNYIKICSQSPKNLTSWLESFRPKAPKNNTCKTCSPQFSITQDADQISDILHSSNLSQTEKETLIKARLGQGKFRKSLIGFWKSCSVTGYTNTRMLKASHIKPWSQSSNEERLNVHNGLLLTPNLDALFDVGLITFDNEGRLKTSAELTQYDLDQLGIDPQCKIRSLDKEHLCYLDYHQENIFQE
jgi:hypothetical protein